jgi:glycosyltransferase 2 family protein
MTSAADAPAAERDSEEAPRASEEAPRASEEARRASEQPPPVGSSGSGWRLGLGGVLFVALTVGVLIWQFRQIPPDAVLPSWSGLRWGWLFLVLGAPILDVYMAGLRIHIACRVAGHPVALWTAMKAELATAGLSLLTPSQSGGGVGQILVLQQAGLRVGTAIAVSLVGFAASVVVLIGVGLYALQVPASGMTVTVFRAAFGTFAIVAVLMIASILWVGVFHRVVAFTSRSWARFRGRHAEVGDGPADHGEMGPLATRIVDAAYAYRRDLLAFLENGKLAFVWICLATFVYFLAKALTALAVLRFLGVDGVAVTAVLQAQAVILFLTYFAPTPGAAGFAEGASLTLMTGAMSAGFLPVYNVLWRTMSVYVQALLGFAVLLGLILRRMRRWVHSPQAPEKTPET